MIFEETKSPPNGFKMFNSIFENNNAKTPLCLMVHFQKSLVQPRKVLDQAHAHFCRWVDRWTNKPKTNKSSYFLNT